MSGFLDDLKLEALTARAKLRAQVVTQPDRGGSFLRAIDSESLEADAVDAMDDVTYQMYEGDAAL